MVLPDLPDLTITGATVPSPSGVGRPIQVSWTVTNVGTQAAFGFWTDEIYLSADTIFSPSDIWIGSFDRGNGDPLQPGASLIRRETIQLPSIPAAGQYTLFFRSNPFADIEESRTDNNLFSLPVTINLDGPDLAIVTATAPASARFGDTINVSWSVRNDGTGAATASWYDDIYLSDDEVFDARDRELAFSVVINSVPLAVGQSYSRSLQVALPRNLLRQGTYYLILRSDPGQVQGEISEANNISVLPISLIDPNAVLPVVTLTTTPAGGVPEDGSGTLSFSFLRSGSTANPLTVRVGLAGTAVLGSDYTITGGPTSPVTSTLVTFAAGSNTATLVIDPLVDADPEENESVSLTLLSGQGYTVGTTTPVT
ncbi:MAG: CARDB domain-containing protein, partial [Cyanobium sp.]